MPYCKKCGIEYVEGARYCTKCGTPIEGWRPPREECFGERREERDHLGLVSFGIFLLIVGYILITNPWIPSDVQSLFENLGKGVFEPPSKQLRYIFALFLGLIGVSNFAMAGIRAIFRQPWRKPLGDMLPGVGLISFAYLVYLNSKGLMTWQIVLVLGVIIIGMLIILYGIIVSYFKKSQK
ncbi:MAG: zinc-ribbon domain-containing protein [Nitrososphaerales archaeon]|nr:zinc-ribbon domain-containing protein [Nitrososphaerales archaeon]